jgi:putative PIN family toxin of toxin-antitoxin system
VITSWGPAPHTFDDDCLDAVSCAAICLLDITLDIVYGIMRVVVDANVILRAFRSKNGASHAILRRILQSEFELVMSPAIVLEYEDVLKRPGMLGAAPAFSEADIDIVLDAICAVAIPVVPWFRFRPFLNDPKDDMYVECALAGGATVIVTNDRHFRHPTVPAFGLTAMSAGDFISAQRRTT